MTSPNVHLYFLNPEESRIVARALREAGWRVQDDEIVGYVSNVVNHLAPGRPGEQAEITEIISEELTRDRQCLRCGHEWQARSMARPRQCPNCHSVKWGEPRA